MGGFWGFCVIILTPILNSPCFPRPPLAAGTQTGWLNHMFSFPPEVPSLTCKRPRSWCVVPWLLCAHVPVASAFLDDDHLLVYPPPVSFTVSVSAVSLCDSVCSYKDSRPVGTESMLTLPSWPKYFFKGAIFKKQSHPQVLGVRLQNMNFRRTQLNPQQYNKN